MAALPSFQSVLQEFHQDLVGYSMAENRPSSQKMADFAEGAMSLVGFAKMAGRLFGEILAELGAVERDAEDLGHTLAQMEAAYCRLMQRTWTFGADERQVHWLLASHFFAPGLARHAAFWTLDGAPDAGMPGGKFWYLPDLRATNDSESLALPVMQVLDWLLDMLGADTAAIASGRNDLTGMSADHRESFRRDLDNWRKGTAVPTIRSVKSYFADNAPIQFKGALVIPDNLSDEDRLSAVRAYVSQKGLTSKVLSHELPLSESFLEEVLTGEAISEKRQHFVRCMILRYSPPSLAMVRRRLLFARAVQEAYRRLLKHLCPGVSPLETDPIKNKLLQLVDIYKYIFNLTIEAHVVAGASGRMVENTWFEKQLRPWDAGTAYLAILPSLEGTRIEALGEYLTRQFMLLRPGSPLEDQIGLSEELDQKLSEDRIKWICHDAQEAARLQSLKLRILQASSWRALQKENSFWVLSQLAQGNIPSAKVRLQVLARLKEAAATSEEKLLIALFELHQLLNPYDDKYQEDVRDKVQSILDEADSSSCAAVFAAPLHAYRARHLLQQNEHEAALKQYRAALDRCMEAGWGPLEGELARDRMGVELANNRLIHQNLEAVFLKMWRGGVLDVVTTPVYEDVARMAASYYWDNLYRPYPGYPYQGPVAASFVAPALKVLLDGDLNAFQDWVSANQKKLQGQLKSVQGDSVLMLFLKAKPQIEGLAHVRRLREADSQLLIVWAQAVRILIETVPEQLTLADFKYQTPLMLAAEAGDDDLLHCMLRKGANSDCQDYKKRTALHAAIRSGSQACVKLLLDHPCRADLAMYEGQTPLHTAVIFGREWAVSILVAKAPSLVHQKDIGNTATPLELAELLRDNPEARAHLDAEVRAGGHRCASGEELTSIIEKLQRFEPPAGE